MLKLKKRDIFALGFLLVFYVCFGIFLTLNQEKVVYIPNQQDFTNCPTLPEAELVYKNKTRMYVHDTGKSMIILYHGNAGSACDRDFYANLFTQAGLDYALVEYTGYSADEVEPSHERVKQNIQDVVAYFGHREDLIVVGESIGTGAASYHSSLKEPEKLILISPFTNLSDIARGRFWFYPTRLMVDNAFDNVESLSKYQGELLIIHGDNDGIIPYSLGQELFKSATTPNKKFETIAGAGHNDLFRYEETYQILSNFLQK